MYPEEKFLLCCTPFCLESFLLYPFVARAAQRKILLCCTPFCLEKVCVVKIGFGEAKFSFLY